MHNRIVSQQPSLECRGYEEGQPGRPGSRHSGRGQRGDHHADQSTLWLSPRFRRCLGREARTRSVAPCGEASRLPSLPGVSGKHRQTRRFTPQRSWAPCLPWSSPRRFESSFLTCSPGPHAYCMAFSRFRPPLSYPHTLKNAFGP